MSKSALIRFASVAGACAAVGAGAGILGGADAASPAGKAARPGSAAAGKRLAGPLRRAVHVEAVVPGGKGRFVDVTLDRGVVKAVNGDQLTVDEGTPKGLYKTVTLTIAAGAKVRENGQASQLSALKPGQWVVVLRGPKQTRVRAKDKRTP